MPLPAYLPAKPLLIGCAAVVGLGVAGGLASWLSRKPEPEVRTERQSETRAAAESEATSELVAMVRQLRTENQTLTAQLQASSRQTNDVTQKVTERIERFVPGPSTSPAPVVILRDGQPAPVGVSGPREPVEIIVRTTEFADRSKTETDTKSETVAKVETKTETDATKTEKVVETASSETVEKSAEKITAKPVAAPELPRFGAGYTSARQPFVSYDLARGPRLLGLDRVGMGLMLTKSNSGGIDGGPLASVSLSKGKRYQPFLGAGYKVKDREGVLTLGVKF